MADPTVSGNVPLGRDPTPPPPAPSDLAGIHLATPPGVVPPPQVPPTMTGAHLGNPPAADPMSRTIDLPSGGIYYRNGATKATVAPMRGEAEIAIAGTPEGTPERVAAVRKAVAACSNVVGVPFGEILLLDFAAISMHVMALSEGTDELGVRPGCEKQECPLAKETITLTSLPCTYLRVADNDAEEPAVEETETNPMILAAIAAEAREKRRAGVEISTGPTIRRLPRATAREPFEARLSNGTTLHWRYHRVKDLEVAEDFVRDTGDTGLGVQAGLGAYLSARQIIRINGTEVGTTEALMWWMRTARPLLKEFRVALRRREFGYDMRPEFICPRSECRKKVQVPLPNDGSLFQPSGS